MFLLPNSLHIQRTEWAITDSYVFPIPQGCPSFLRDVIFFLILYLKFTASGTLDRMEREV